MPGTLTHPDAPPRSAKDRAPDGRESRLLHGRRRGRALRPGQAALLQALLPELRFTLSKDRALDPRDLFPAPVAALWLEIGFGGGEHLAAQAASRPEIGFLGAEIFENGIVKLLSEIRHRALANVRLFVDDARLLLDALPAQSLDRVFILFPDPWPKERHKKRRIVSRETLDALARVMAEGAELRLATDDIDYARWMLERTTAHPDFGWLARGPRDWRVRPEDWPQSRYERKAIAAGRPPVFLRFARKPRGV